MAEDETYGNPFGLTCVSDLEESNEESSFDEASRFKRLAFCQLTLEISHFKAQ